jgi:hypothetical protein
MLVKATGKAAMRGAVSFPGCASNEHRGSQKAQSLLKNSAGASAPLTGATGYWPAHWVGSVIIDKIVQAAESPDDSRIGIGKKPHRSVKKDAGPAEKIYSDKG